MEDNISHEQEFIINDFHIDIQPSGHGEEMSGFCETFVRQRGVGADSGGYRLWGAGTAYHRGVHG